jgi:hypothetical protein
MYPEIQIPEPVLFNPLKHHLGFIKEFIDRYADTHAAENILSRELRHLGTSVMDVYTGSLKVYEICSETIVCLRSNNVLSPENFSSWAGTKVTDFRIITLSDGSEWTVKYHENSQRFIHIFPARCSRNTFRIKSNTLKSALIYCMLIGKDFVTGADLNRVRAYLDLSPVKEVENTEAITEMIELIRNNRE